MRCRRAAAGRNTNVGKEQGEQQHTWEWNTRGYRLFQNSQRTLFFYKSQFQLKQLFLLLFIMVRNMRPAPCENSKIELLKKRITALNHSSHPIKHLWYAFPSRLSAGLHYPTSTWANPCNQVSQSCPTPPQNEPLTAARQHVCANRPLEWRLKLSTCLELAVGGRPPSPYGLG